MLDTRLTVETPEGIALTLRPAGIVARFYAFALDFAIRLGVLIAAQTLLVALGGAGLAIFFLLWFAVEWFYPVVFELLPGSASPGKRAVGLMVVMDSGLPITVSASIVRNLLRTADFLPAAFFLGALSMLWRHDFKRLGDIAAGTLVVHTRLPKLDGSLVEAPPLAPAFALDARSQAAVLAWSGRHARVTGARMDELARMAAPAVAPASSRDASDALAGVAQYLVGKR